MELIVVYIDNNCINAKCKNSAMNELERLNRENRIILKKTDTLDTELHHGSPYTPGIKKSQDYIESPGPGIFNHSRWNHALFFDDRFDFGRLERIIEILWGVDDKDKTDKNWRGDAMHISTAAKYNGDFFVTTEKRLLKHHDLIRSEFGLSIVAPETCLEDVCRRLGYS